MPFKKGYKPWNKGKHANPTKYAARDVMIGKRTAQDIWDHDNYVTEELQAQGHIVMRIWESRLIKI